MVKLNGLKKGEGAVDWLTNVYFVEPMPKGLLLVCFSGGWAKLKGKELLFFCIRLKLKGHGAVAGVGCWIWSVYFWLEVMIFDWGLFSGSLLLKNVNFGRVYAVSVCFLFWFYTAV